MSVTIADLKSRLPQTGLAKVSDTDLATHITKAKKEVEASGASYTSDQLDILTLHYACYTVAIALQGTNMTVDPNYYMDAYKLALAQIGNNLVKTADLTGNYGIITVGRLRKVPNFR
jgi:hypothetical protein